MKSQFVAKGIKRVREKEGETNEQASNKLPPLFKDLAPALLDSLQKHWFILAAVVVNAVSNVVVVGGRVRQQQQQWLACGTSWIHLLTGLRTHTHSYPAGRVWRQPMVGSLSRL